MRHLDHRRQALDEFFSDRQQEQEDRHPEEDSEEEGSHSYDHFPTYQSLAPEPEEPKPTTYSPTNNVER